MKATLAAALLFALSGTAGADTLQIPSAGEGAVPVPSKGMSMTAVERQFGRPNSKLPAIGEPPISRWIYRDYKVFFEHQHVIHSVRTGTR